MLRFSAGYEYERHEHPRKHSDDIADEVTRIDLSKKKRVIPAIVIITAMTSARLKRCFLKTADIKSTNMGEVNCSTMAFAAVVSLFAATNNTNRQHKYIPLRSARRVNTNLKPPHFMYMSMVSAEMRLRIPTIGIGPKGISFINIPPMLHIAAHSSICKTAFVVCLLLVFCSVVIFLSVCGTCSSIRTGPFSAETCPFVQI